MSTTGGSTPPAGRITSGWRRTRRGGLGSCWCSWAAGERPTSRRTGVRSAATGRLGYHAIVLAYANEAPVSALPPIGCGNNVDPPASPPNCAFNARMEILDGKGESTVVSVDRANSIENRLTKLLQHLAATYPGEGWSQFV